MATVIVPIKHRPSPLRQPEPASRPMLHCTLHGPSILPRANRMQSQARLAGAALPPSHLWMPRHSLVSLPGSRVSRTSQARPLQNAANCGPPGSAFGLATEGDASATLLINGFSSDPYGTTEATGAAAVHLPLPDQGSRQGSSSSNGNGSGRPVTSSASASNGSSSGGGGSASTPASTPADGTGTAAAAAAVAAAALPAPATQATQPPQAPPFLAKLQTAVNKIRPLVETVMLLCMWYASNIFYNIYNKQVLQVFPYATTCTCLHLVVAIALLSSLWIFRIKKVPQITERTLARIFPLGVLHLLGFLTTNMSLGAVNVSLTHTIKSLEPFFTVLLSLFFFGSLPALPVLVTLIPIVMGVVVASATDLSFNWYGFITAMGSNLAFQSRNVLSKKYMVESSLESLEGSLNSNEVLDEVDLFLLISLLALPMAIPVVWAMEGPALAARFVDASGDTMARAAAVMTPDVLVKNLLAGACRTADVFASYGLLSRLSPVTHSVANCVKRVVVIAVSILFFKTQSSYLNIVGTVLALGGVFAYSMAERMTPKRPKQMTLPGQQPRSASSKLGTWLQALALSLVPSILKQAWREREERLLEAKLKVQEAEAEANAKAQAEREAKEGKSPDYFL